MPRTLEVPSARPRVARLSIHLLLPLLLAGCGAPGGTGPGGADRDEQPSGDSNFDRSGGRGSEGGGGGEGSAGSTRRAGDDRTVAGGPPILVAHNRLRAAHCAAPLSWSEELEAAARRWVETLAARGCAFDHDPQTEQGENLAYFAPAGSRSPEEVAELWHSEVSRYDFRRATFSMEAGHFTQLVWAATERLGCASATCGGGTLWVCRYDPPGNVMGAFAANVKPTSCKR